MKQFIIKLPEGTKLDNLSDQVKDIIKHLRGEFPSNELVGSKTVDGYELKLIMANIDLESLNSILSQGYPMIDDDNEEVIVDLELDWEIMAAEGTVIEQSEILPFILDKLIFDSEGEIIDYQPVTDLTGILQTYAGHSWSY